jgi:hypothetical protein
MDRKLHSAARQLGVKGDLLFEAERRKQLLANAILIRLRDEVYENPEADELRFPLPTSIGKMERFVLSHYPEDIAERIPSSRKLSLEIDESVEPPLLSVSIGAIKQPPEAIV